MDPRLRCKAAAECNQMQRDKATAHFSDHQSTNAKRVNRKHQKTKVPWSNSGNSQSVRLHSLGYFSVTTAIKSLKQLERGNEPGSATNWKKGLEGCGPLFLQYLTMIGDIGTQKFVSGVTITFDYWVGLDGHTAALQSDTIGKSL